MPKSLHPGQTRQSARDSRCSPGQAVRDLSLPHLYPSSRPRVRFSLAGGECFQNGASSPQLQNGSNCMARSSSLSSLPAFSCSPSQNPFYSPNNPFLSPTPPKTPPSCQDFLSLPFPQALPRCTASSCTPKDISSLDRATPPERPRLCHALPVPTLGIRKRKSWILELRVPVSCPLLQ